MAGVRTDLLALPLRAPGTAVVMANRRDPSLFDVWHIPLDGGEPVLELENPGGVVGFACDAEGRVRVALRQIEGGHHELLARPPGGELAVLHRFDRDDDGHPLVVSEDGASVLVRSAEGSDLARLVRLDLGTAETEVVDAHDEAELEDLWLAWDDRPLAAVYRTHAGLELRALDLGVADDLVPPARACPRQPGDRRGGRRGPPRGRELRARPRPRRPLPLRPRHRRTRVPAPPLPAPDT